MKNAETPPEIARAPNTVSVACKFPVGLRLRVWEYAEQHVDVMGGGQRTIQVPRPHSKFPDEVIVKGPAVPFGQFPTVPIVGGYAITHGINAEFFELWLFQHKDTDLVKNRIVFSSDKLAAATDHVVKEAIELASIRTGLEKLDPEMVHKDGKLQHVDPRFPTRIDTGKRT